MAAKVQLTASNVHTLPAPAKGQKDFPDKLLPGFMLRVSASGARSFVLMYRPKAGAHQGKLTRWTIGSLAPKDQPSKDGRFALADARTIARTAKARIQDEAADPAREAMAVEAEAPTRDDGFRAAVEKYHQTYQLAKKANRTADRVQAILLKHCAGWSSKAVADITKRDIHDVLDGLMAAKKPYMANRVHSHLRTFFKWCVGRDFVDHSPMEGIDKPFDGEKPRERHYSDDELKAIWKACDQVGTNVGDAVKLMLLTGKRRGEIFGLRWDELDLDLENGFWNLPAERTKNKRAHAMPLSKLAVRIMDKHSSLKGNPYAFWGRRQGGHLNGFKSITDTIREKSGVEDFEFHACRHTLKTRLGGLGIPPHVKDKVLHHAPPKTAGEGYDHYDYESEQREALEAWANQLQEIVQGEGVAVLR